MKLVQGERFECESIRYHLEGQDEEVVASATMTILYDNPGKPPFAEIDSVVVPEEYRGEGLGTMIMKELITLATEKGCRKMVLTARYSNEAAHRFYTEKLGFRDHGKAFRLDLNGYESGGAG